MAVSGGDEIGSGLQGAGQEYVVGRVLRNSVADLGATRYKDDIFFEKIYELPDKIWPVNPGASDISEVSRSVDIIALQSAIAGIIRVRILYNSNNMRFDIWF